MNEAEAARFAEHGSAGAKSTGGVQGAVLPSAVNLLNGVGQLGIREGAHRKMSGAKQELSVPLLSVLRGPLKGNRPHSEASGSWSLLLN